MYLVFLLLLHYLIEASAFCQFIIPNSIAQARSVSGTRGIGERGFSFLCKCSCFVQITKQLGMGDVFRGAPQVTNRHMCDKAVTALQYFLVVQRLFRRLGVSLGTIRKNSDPAAGVEMVEI